MNLIDTGQLCFNRARSSRLSVHLVRVKKAKARLGLALQLALLRRATQDRPILLAALGHPHHDCTEGQGCHGQTRLGRWEFNALMTQRLRGAFRELWRLGLFLVKHKVLLIFRPAAGASMEGPVGAVNELSADKSGAITKP